MKDRDNTGTVSNIATKKQGVRKEPGISSPPSPLKKRLYSVPEAAMYLGRSIWSVRALIWNGELPHIRVGRRIHLDIIDLDQWVDKNKIRTFL